MSTIKKADIEDILEALNEYDYEYFGIRIEDYLPEAESILPESINHETGEPIDGVSVLEVKPGRREQVARALEDTELYFGKYLVVLGSDRTLGHGEDPGERILVEPIILERFLRPSRFVPGRIKR